MERNNLMRLAHSIPFTPVSLIGKMKLIHSHPCELCTSHWLRLRTQWISTAVPLTWSIMSLSCVPAMGEEVSVYTLEEAGESTGGRDLSVSSWSPRGLSAILQPLSDEGVLDGGLRRARRVACTWAQEGVLKPGCIYVVKAFRPEVVRMWQKVFHSDTSLHLCLRVLTFIMSAHDQISQNE